ncbi:MAG: hypothetical protein F4064_01410 [Acidimicrobiales bacterium]|nr:hypothetical protein [Acidimicrobiales bacterium]
MGKQPLDGLQPQNGSTINESRRMGYAGFSGQLLDFVPLQQRLVTVAQLINRRAEILAGCLLQRRGRIGQVCAVPGFIQ